MHVFGRSEGGYMRNTITISSRSKDKDSSEHKIVSVRMKIDLLEKLDDIAAQTNRSRNEVINILLESAVEIATVQK